MSETEMVIVFERIRDAVLQEATRPSPYSADQHAANKSAFMSKLRGLCSEARLRPDMTTDDLWRHVWTKVRYSGFKASYVTGEIERLTPLFDDYRALTGPEWYFDPIGIEHGIAVREFLDRSGRFAGISYSRLAPKLLKILTTAKAFSAFPTGAPALMALFGDHYDEADDKALWRSHEQLAELVGFTTALHIMMDIGFNCVKPDIWLVRLMCVLDWIEDILPATSPDDVIKRTYQKPSVARAVISRARQISKAIRAWHPKAPLREFDFVMVKYGQRPGEFGIVRSLHGDWLPIQRIMEWQPSTGQ